MKDKLLNQTINLDAFLWVNCILAANETLYVAEDGDLVLKIEGEKIVIEEYKGDDSEDLTVIHRITSNPKTVSDGLNLINVIFGWNMTEDEKEDILCDYMVELNRRKMNSEIEEMKSKYLGSIPYRNIK